MNSALCLAHLHQSASKIPQGRIPNPAHHACPTGAMPNPDPSIGSLGSPGSPYPKGCATLPEGACPAFLLGAAVLAAGLAGEAGRANPLVCFETTILGGLTSAASYDFFFGSKYKNLTAGSSNSPLFVGIITRSSTIAPVKRSVPLNSLLNLG